MENDHFIVNLISNASMDVFPDNKLSAFCTSYNNNHIELEGEWEVALTEIAFPIHIKNVVEGKFKYYDINPVKLVEYDLSIPSRLYLSTLDVLKAINTAIKYSGVTDTDNVLTVSIEKITNRAVIRIVKEAQKIEFVSKDLQTILGFTGKVYEFDPSVGKRILAEYPHDINRIHTMFVYMDIIGHPFVGDRIVKLLRAVSLVSKCKNGETNVHQSQIVRTFTPLEYRPVTTNT